MKNLLQKQYAAILSVSFFYVGIAIAFMAWRYGDQAWLILLLPAIWGYSRSGLNGFMLFLGYYLAFALDAPQSLVKFDTNAGKLYGELLWVAHAAILSLPWFVITKEKWRQAAIALPLTVIPPIGILNWGHPLIATGGVLPGAGLTGLVLCYGFMVWSVWAADRLRHGLNRKEQFITALPGILFCMVCAGFSISWMHRHDVVDRWVGVNTEFGGINSGLLPFQRHQAMAKSARQKEADGFEVIIFPEEAGGEWTERKLIFWHEIKDGRAMVIVGGDVRLKVETSLNAAINAKTGEVIAFARIPMPVGNWRLSGESSVAHPFESNVRAIQGQKTSFLFCFEETLIYPLALDVISGAKKIISMSNTWSTAGTPSRDMQRRTIEMQARLYGLPLTRSENS